MDHNHRYRVILHGPSVWKGATRPPDADQQAPFIVAFEPQNDLVEMQQGTLELDDFFIDEITCTTQIFSIFFFEMQEQAVHAQQALSRSLDRLQTVYDIFQNTRVLEALEQALGSVHMPLEVVVSRTDLTGDEKGRASLNADKESYTIRMAVSQGLTSVTPETNLLEVVSQAVARKGALLNRVSISFYELPGNRATSVAQTPAHIGVSGIIGKSGKSTPRNLTRGTTPCARVGKAVVDLYSKRGLINPPTPWMSAPYNENVLVASSPVLKATVDSKQLEELLHQSDEGLRSVSQDQYIHEAELKNLNLPTESNNDLKEIPIEKVSLKVNGGLENQGFDFDDVRPPSSDRTNASGIANAVDMALQLFDTWNFDDYEVVKMPERVIQIPRSASRKVSIGADEEKVKKLENENKELHETNANRLQEIANLQNQIDELELDLRRQVDTVRLQHEIETAKLQEALKDRERVISEINTARSSADAGLSLESAREIQMLSKEIDSVTEEKQGLLKQVQLMTAERNKMADELDSLKARISEVTSMENAVKQIQVEKEGQMAVMRDFIGKLKMEKESMASDLNKYRRENKKLGSELKHAKFVEEQLKDTLKRFEVDVSHLNDTEYELKASKAVLKEKDGEIKTLKLDVERLNDERAKAELTLNDFRKQLSEVTEKARNLQEELYAERKISLEQKETIKNLEATKCALEMEIQDGETMKEKLRHDKSEAVDRYLKEKIKHDCLLREHDLKSNRLSGQVKELSTKLNLMAHKYDQLRGEYASHLIRSSIRSSLAERKIESDKETAVGLMNTVLKSKAELARKRCQLRLMAKALQMPSDTTDKDILSELRKPRTLDSLTQQKIKNYEKLKAAYSKLKTEKDEQAKLLETKTSAYNKYVRRHDQLHEENRRLITALASEREKLSAMEMDAKRQIRDEVIKVNEDKRLLHAKQCELMMENQVLKQEVGMLKQQVALQLDSFDIDRKESIRSYRYESLDGNKLVIKKLSNMSNVLGSGDVKHGGIRCRISDTTFEDDLSIDCSGSVDFDRQRTIEKPYIAGSPCAYKDTRASFYSRKATLEKMRTRQQLKEDYRPDGIYGENGIRNRHPWVF
ncbi:centromere-associated E, putative [Babesia ovata]|uniref:Centromere-associated E, putative n=1 Tax=Babesia ovata TaxID=189622 RepID=A0A2H6K958_9APIC|nr:centromere-associated E, putative [Babesia ovata]GBE59489.1 centromere-associated E, putative [Babesia ovata]